ncbi:MAG: hypothetical protein NT134_00910, partial [Chloroflexi bacterium]|nr:hypothetical protein [Chloroflexota bacterium]
VILNAYYRPTPQAPPGYYYLGTSKKQIIEGIVEEVDKQGSLGVLIRILDETIKYGETLTSDEAQQAVNSLKHIKMGIQKREVGLTESKKEVRQKVKSKPEKEAKEKDLAELRQQYLALLKDLDSQKRGYALQGLLYKLFDLSGLKPGKPFRIEGEEIDGDFVLAGDNFLLEAKWEKDKPTAADLYGFQGKVERKFEGTRGLFISIMGFSDSSLDAFGKGKRSNFVVMDGEGLMFILEDRINLSDFLSKMVRHASRTGNIYLKARDILSETS